MFSMHIFCQITWFADIFSHSVACLFTLFREQTVFILMKFNLSNFPFLLLVSNLTPPHLTLGPKILSYVFLKDL